MPRSRLPRHADRFQVVHLRGYLSEYAFRLLSLAYVAKRNGYEEKGDLLLRYSRYLTNMMNELDKDLG